MQGGEEEEEEESLDLIKSAEVQLDVLKNASPPLLRPATTCARALHAPPRAPACLVYTCPNEKTPKKKKAHPSVNHARLVFSTRALLTDNAGGQKLLVSEHGVYDWQCLSALARCDEHKLEVGNP